MKQLICKATIAVLANSFNRTFGSSCIANSYRICTPELQPLWARNVRDFCTSNRSLFFTLAGCRVLHSRGWLQGHSRRSQRVHNYEPQPRRPFRFEFVGLQRNMHLDILSLSPVYWRKSGLAPQRLGWRVSTSQAQHCCWRMGFCWWFTQFLVNLLHLAESGGPAENPSPS